MAKIKINQKKNYIAMIRSSIGSKMFASAFGEINGVNKNLTQNGKLSCSYFVSSILKIFNVIESIHLTVNGTVEDMKKSGWKETSLKKLAIGDVILWPEKDGHGHLGFYTGNRKAISNDSKRRSIQEHHYTFSGTRKIEKVLTKKM
jgi:hypothetical protein